jgi:hypothetical protein
LLASTNAATYFADSQAEQATLSGKVVVVPQATASGANALKFGVATAETPYDLRAYTGGNSIALQWQLTPVTTASEQGPAKFEVLRNGTLIKTITSRLEEYPAAYNTGFVGYNVTKGQTYSYQVRRYDPNGTVSPLSTALSVTHPSNPRAEPSISINTANLSSALADEARNKMVPFLKTWYPKMVGVLAGGEYNPDNTFEIKFSRTSAAGFSVSTVVANWHSQGLPTVVTINPDFYASEGRPYLYSMVMNSVMEATHHDTVAQPAWLDNGINGYTTYQILGTEKYRYAVAGSYYNASVRETAKFMAWLRQKYGPAIIQKLASSVVFNRYSDSIFSQATGKSLAQLQAEWQPASHFKGPVPVTFKAYPNQCVDNNLDGGKTDERVQIWPCNGTAPQQWTTIKLDDTDTFALKSATNCMVASQYATNDIRAAMTDCTGPATGAWRQTASGGIESVYRPGRCLETPGGTTTQGTWLMVAVCDGSPKQQLSQLP